ncbi:MAG: ABC transporter permease [Chloroflexi bacterium]|nr:ABC transporter permease [Chloroflexota bacterium]
MARRLVAVVPALLGVSVVIFVMIRVLPGDPLATLLGAQGSNPADRAILARTLGFDEPMPLQYLHWLGRLLTGDLGFSYVRHYAVGELIGAAIGRTAVLAGAGAVIGLVTGIGLGTAAAFRPGRLLDRAVSALAITGMSVPSFWLGILLIILFSATLQWLPASGMAELADGPADFLAHLIMPALANAAITIGLTARTTRSSLIETYGEDFVYTLRAKGLSDAQILRHVAKNAAPAILTMIGLQVGYLLGGSVLVETIFAWPGLGNLIYTAILARDLILIQSSLLVIAVTFILLNLVVDMLQIVVNPRVRRLASA